MKAIVVMYDSLNRHMLSSYGCDWTLTPNMSQLAERSVTFDTHFVGSMPCMPARREMHTGRYNFLHRGWGPWEPFDDSCFQIMGRSGVYTHLVSDHYHYWEDGGATYHHRYNSWVNVRGHEGDAWKARWREGKACYNHEWEGPHFDWPKYERVQEDPEAQEHLRYEYAALLTQCDHYLGTVIEAMDRYQLWSDTLLIVMTDHGFLLGEHEWWAKVRMPYYNEISHIPMFMWDPRLEIAGARRSSLTQTIDIAPTLLEFFDLDIPEDVMGSSLKTVCDNDTPIRDVGLFGMFGGHVNVTDGNYVYMRGPTPGNQPLYHYTLMPTHMRAPFSVEELRQMRWHDAFAFTKECPVMQIPSRMPERWLVDLETKLFDMRDDPGQERPLDDPAIEQTMIEKLREQLALADAPPDQYERLGLND